MMNELKLLRIKGIVDKMLASMKIIICTRCKFETPKNNVDVRILPGTNFKRIAIWYGHPHCMQRLDKELKSHGVNNIRIAGGKYFER